jgi:hypothetical protein
VIKGKQDSLKRDTKISNLQMQTFTSVHTALFSTQVGIVCTN